MDVVLQGIIHVEKNLYNTSIFYNDDCFLHIKARETFYFLVNHVLYVKQYCNYCS